MANRKEKWTWGSGIEFLMFLIWVIGGLVVVFVLLPWDSWCVPGMNYVPKGCSLLQMGRDTLLLLGFWVLWFLLSAGIYVGVTWIVDRFRAPPDDS